MRWITAVLVLAVLTFAQAEAWAFDYQYYTATIDECDRPKPLDGYGFHRAGGSRGTMNDYDYTPAPGTIRFSWDNDSKYTAKVMTGSWTWGGMTYNLIRDWDANIPLNFDSVFGMHVLPAYQGEIVGIEIVISSVSSPSNNPNLKLKVEAKDISQNPVSPSPWYLEQLITRTYPYTYYIDLSSVNLGDIETLNWLIDGARLNDEITVDSVKLRVKVPVLPIQDEAFLWSYAWLMANYDEVSGMVQDHSNYVNGAKENVSATGKTAKVVAYAWKKGMTSQTDAQAIITKIAGRLTNASFPKGPSSINTLWPHFTINGGTAKEASSEWASGDTAYAALDVITALKLIGDPLSQIPSLESFLRAINWQAMILPTGYISLGYGTSGSLLGYGWDCFGMESVGVNWAYASATGNFTSMLAPPNYNGSGFIDNAQYPMCFSGLDRWGNNWDTYRNDKSNAQIGWYTEAKNHYLHADGLFGLSAAEVPEADDPAVTEKYKAYGTGGMIPAEDGNAEVIVLHYGGMISDIRLADAARVWQLLRNRGDLSPLTNIESMRVNKTTGSKTIRHFKGSWNLALQAEGWAMANPVLRQELLDKVMANDFLKSGYLLLKGYYTLHLGIQDTVDIFPKETQSQPYYSGAASALMNLKFLDGAYNKSQDTIYNTYHSGAPGQEMNQGEVAAALNAEAPLVYNFTALTDTDQLLAVKRLIHWMDYQVIGATGAPNVPVLIPTDGAYNWKVVRGFVSDRDPCDQGDLFRIPDSQVFGFWLNDPRSAGLGFNVYLTATEFLTMYSALGGNYISVAEPPDRVDRKKLDSALRKQKIRFAKGKEHAVARRLKESSAANTTDDFQDASRIRGFDWKSLLPQELKQDTSFTAIFDKLKFSRVLKAEDTDGKAHYILALFADKPSSPKVKAALMLNAESGEFKQASWAVAGEEFPKISRQKAVSLAQKKLGPGYAFKSASFAWSRKFNISKFLPSYRLVFRDTRPSKLPKKDVIVFVHQDGSVGL